MEKSKGRTGDNLLLVIFLSQVFLLMRRPRKRTEFVVKIIKSLSDVVFHSLSLSPVQTSMSVREGNTTATATTTASTLWAAIAVSVTMATGETAPTAVSLQLLMI